MNDASHAKTLLKLLFEVGLVSLGVFLALIAGQWRDTREHRAQANATLRYFRDDLVANQHAILAERAYHESLMREVDGYLNSPEPKTTQSFDASVHFKGIHPIIFERTAWDLAVGNQTLSNLDPSLAYAISRVYTRQQEFQTMENGFMQAAFAPTSFTTQDPTGFVTALSVYMHDVNIEEPSLLKSYEQLLPQIDAAVPRKQP